MLLFDPEKDLTAVQNVFLNDSALLSLMGLSSATPLEKAKQIIKRSQYDDLTDAKKRLCIFFIPSRQTRNSDLFEEVIQIDCHVPITEDYKARQIISRVIYLLDRKRLNGRILKIAGHLGELPTAQGFYCYGVRFNFYEPL